MNPTIDQDLSVWTSTIEGRTLTRVVERVARALVARASPASRAALARVVGDAALRGAESEPAVDIAALYEAIAHEASMRPAAAIELAQDTLSALAHAIGPVASRLLASEVPPSWACMLGNPHDVPSDRTPAPAPDRREGRTLASGRSGASAPLCDASPVGAQTDSIASSDDPHGDRKLSGADGSVPRRRTLADGGG